MGAVERVLVLGIVVVIVAILGIAVWGAAGDNSSKVVAATDGGAVVTGQEPPAATMPPLAQSSPGDSEGSPAAEIDVWHKLRDQERESRSTAPADGAAAPASGGTAPVAMGADGAPASNLLPGSGGPPLVLRNTSPLLEKTVTVQPLDGASSSAPVTSKAAGKDAKAKDAASKGTAKGAAAADASSPGTYTVAKGDSLWKIAHSKYGDADIQGHIDAILAANPKLDPDSLKVGTKITLPGKVTTDKSRLPAREQVVQKGDGTLYEVAAGDTLSSIARKQLGDQSKWKLIYDLNRERIADPAKIAVGTSLRLPPKN